LTAVVNRKIQKKSQRLKR